MFKKLFKRELKSKTNQERGKINSEELSNRDWTNEELDCFDQAQRDKESYFEVQNELSEAYRKRSTSPEARKRAIALAKKQIERAPDYVKAIHLEEEMCAKNEPSLRNDTMWGWVCIDGYRYLAEIMIEDKDYDGAVRLMQEALTLSYYDEYEELLKRAQKKQIVTNTPRS